MFITRQALLLSLALTVGFNLMPANAQQRVNPRPGYLGVFTKSEPNRIGGQVTFANLDTLKPFVTWPSGSGAQTNKVFEDEEFVVLFFVASVSGGTETFYLNKKSKTFTLVEATLLGTSGPGQFVEPKVSFGVLK